MTLSTTASAITVAGNGTSTAFTFNFVGDSASDIIVQYIDASGVITNLISSQYSIALNAPTTGQLWGIGGTVTYPLTGPAIGTGTYLCIQRVVPYTQESSIRNQGNYYAQVTETAFDTLAMQIQQVDTIAQRSIQIPVADTTGTNVIVPSQIVRANGGSGSLLGFDSSGNAILYTTNIPASLNPSFDSIISPILIGGITGSSTLTLESTSAAANPANTDSIIFKTSNMPGAQSTNPGNLWINDTGSLLYSQGNNGTVLGLDSTNPLIVPQSGSASPAVKTGIASVVNLTGTLGTPIQQQALLGIGYNDCTDGSGLAAVQGTATAIAASSTVWAFGGNTIALGAGSSAIGMELGINVFAAGALTIGLILEFAGDNVSGHNGSAYQLMKSSAATPNNTPSNGILFGDGGSGTPVTNALILTNAVACVDGIDLTGNSSSYSGHALKTPSFSVDGSGNIASGNIAVSTGGATITVTSTTTTNAAYASFNNAGHTYVGTESSTGGALFTGSSAFASVIGSIGGAPLQFFTSNTLVGQFTSAGVFETKAGFQVDASGNVTPNSIVGVTTNSNAPAGAVGEYIFSDIPQGSAVSLSSGTATNVTSISLTGGDWEVYASVNFTGGATTTVNQLSGYINTTSGTGTNAPGQNTTTTYGGSTVFNSILPSFYVGTVRMPLATTTTIYLIAFAIFGTSTCSAYGIISARRPR